MEILLLQPEMHKLQTSYPCPIQQRYSIILQNVKFSASFLFPQLDTEESTNRTYQSLVCTDKPYIELLFSFHITRKCLLIIG